MAWGQPNPNPNPKAWALCVVLGQPNPALNNQVAELGQTRIVALNGTTFPFGKFLSEVRVTGRVTV